MHALYMHDGLPVETSGARESAGTGCSGDERRHDVGGVPIQASSSPVVAHRRARVGVAGCFLDVSERDAGVEGCGDERVSKAVWRDALVDPGALHQSLDHPISAVAVHPSTFDAEEDRPHRAFPDVQIERPPGAGCDRDGDVLAARAHDRQRAMPPLAGQVVDVGVQRFGDPQPVQREQADQHAIAEITEAGLDKQCAEFVAIQPEGERLPTYGEADDWWVLSVAHPRSVLRATGPDSWTNVDAQLVDRDEPTESIGS